MQKLYRHEPQNLDFEIRRMYLEMAQAPTILSGSGAPSTIPDKIGNIYCDTVGAKVYVSVGIAASTDWKILN